MTIILKTTGYFFAAVAVLVAVLWPARDQDFSVKDEKAEGTQQVASTPQPARTIHINLDVPYINEAPENIWTGSWKNGCEEAIIAMAEKYYLGIKEVSIAEQKEYMQALFNFQQAAYGSDANSDVARTFAIIESRASFGAKIAEDPTVEEIKKELAAGRLVLGFHRGFDLRNKNIPFLPTGSSYHTTVIKGYDDSRREFIVNDPGDTKEGAGHRYDYDLYIRSLRDYNYATKQVDGPPRVLFTFAKN